MTPPLHIADIAYPDAGATTMIQLSMLGTAQIKIGRTVFTPVRARRFALLLYLIHERPAVIPRPTLLELFLHDQLRNNANHSLRELLYELRKTGVPLTSNADGVGFAGASVVSDFDGILAAPTLSESHLDAVNAGFLPGYVPDLSRQFGRWVDALRSHAAFALSERLVTELRRVHAHEDWVATDRIARACLRLNPLNEDATLALAERLALAGAKTDAMQLLDQYILDIGGRSSPLSLPAFLLRRRIGERLPQRYGFESILPFVGRKAEMTTLADRLDRACAGESGCAVLLGEPGIGKTRIASEFVARSALKGVRFVAATAHPHDTRRPMGAFVDVVPQLLDLPGALGCSPASMAALKRLTYHDATAQDTIVDFPEQAEEVAFSIARAISDLVDAISSEAPLILWLEDVHWLDEMSLQMAASLVSSRISRRLLLVMTTRERRPLAGHCGEHATTIIVRPLTTEAARILAADALAVLSGGDESNLHWLVATAAGNPFFLTSLVNHVARTGERHAIPATISELLDQRIAALSSQAMNVLEACVLLGKHATSERVVAAMQLPHFQLVTMLKELEDQRIIVKNRDLIQVSHWLIADAVRRGSSPIATELSHRRIAELLEAEARDTQSPALLWDCGEHWLASGNATKAIQTIRECSRYAVEIGRSREGAELLQRAAQLVNGELHVQLIEESIRLAGAASERDVVVAGVKALRTAGVSSGHDDIEVAELLADALVGDDTFETVERLRRCLDDSGSTPEHKLQLSYPLMVFCAQHQQHALAREAMERLEPIVHSKDGVTPENALEFQLVYHAYFGNREEAVRLGRMLATRADLPASGQVNARARSASALWRCGHSCEALIALESARAIAEQSGLKRLQFVTTLTLGNFHIDAGNAKLGHDYVSRAETLADAIPALRNNFEYLIVRTDVASATCNLDELKALYHAAEELGIPASNERITRWMNTLSMLIDHLSGRIDDPKVAISTLTAHHRAGEIGDAADFEMAVALRISRANERPIITRRRLKKYLSSDRSGFSPLSSMLHQGVASLGTMASRRRIRPSQKS